MTSKGGYQVKVEGREQLVSYLRRKSGVNTWNQIRQPLNFLGRRMTAFAKKIVPVDTGLLKRSIRHRVIVGKRGYAAVYLGYRDKGATGRTGAYYGVFVERGRARGKRLGIQQSKRFRWGSKVGKGEVSYKVGAKPFLVPSIKAHRGEAISVLSREIPAILYDRKYRGKKLR